MNSISPTRVRFWPIILAIVIGANDLRATTVSNLTQTALVAALTNSSPVTFATNGTITLTNTVVITNHAIIDGSGFAVTIAGNNAVRLFRVTNNAVLTLLNLTLANGKSSNGAAILNTGGTVVLSNCVFSGNLAIGNAARDGNDSSGHSDGGDGSAGFPGFGGAIFNQDGIVSMDRCSLIGNAASGSNGGLGGAGGDGSQFGGNGGDGGNGAAGFGGAIYNRGTLLVTNSLFQFNFAAGGDGGTGGDAGSGSIPGRFGEGGRGANAFGGAIYNAGLATVTHTAFLTNSASGGDSMAAGSESSGRDGGSGYGGGISNVGSLSVTNSTFFENSAKGGKGGNVFGGNLILGGDGGNAFGGALHSSNVIYLISSTLATNHAVGGTNGISPFSGNNGSRGQSLGGNLQRQQGQFFLRSTILARGHSGANATGAIIDGGHNLSSDGTPAFNSSSTSDNFIDALLSPLANHGSVAPVLAINTNSPAFDADDTTFCEGVDQRGVSRPQGFRCDIGAFEFLPRYSISGRVIEGTNGLSGITVQIGTSNVISTATGGFTLGNLASGSYLITPVVVGSGFTPSTQQVTVGTNAAFPVIGTNATNVIFTALPPSLSATISAQTNLAVRGIGIPGKIYRIEASTNLTRWTLISTNNSSASGSFQFTATNAFGQARRFFRAVATSRNAPVAPPTP